VARPFFREQAHQRKRRLALAGTGLTDDAERFTFREREGQVIDCGDFAFRCGEANVQVVDVEQSTGGARPPEATGCPLGGQRTGRSVGVVHC